MNVNVTAQDYSKFIDDFSRLKKCSLSKIDEITKDPPYVSMVYQEGPQNVEVCGYSHVGLERAYFVVNKYKSQIDNADKCSSCQQFVEVHDSFAKDGSIVCESCAGKLIRGSLPREVRPEFRDYVQIEKLNASWEKIKKEIVND